MGKRRLEQALAQARAQAPGWAEFEVRWRPFQLNASAPKGRGVVKLDHYNTKFGPARVAQIVPYMVGVGKQHGIEFSYGGHIGNTFDSHRLLTAAYKEGGAALQDKLVEELFKAYFEQEKSMGEAAVLATCAEKAGMKDTAAAVLADESLMAEETQAEMRQYGRAVSGVPFFIVDGAYALSGAQEPEAFLDLFKKLGMPS